jgi:tetratricopeptide (TPR) repeat protein
MRTAVSAVVLVCFLQSQLRAAPPSSAARHFHAAQTHLDMGEFDDAIAELKSALELDASPEYLFHLGQAYRLKKEKKTALDYYKQYLGIAPNGPQATQAKVYIASLSMDVDKETPPPPVAAPPPAYTPPPPAYVPPPIYDRKLMKQRLSICVDGPDDWAYCGYKQRTLGENDFIRSYHRVTGRADLDEHMDYSYRRNKLIAVGSVTAGFLAMIIIGAVVLGTGTSDGFGRSNDGSIAGGITLMGLGGAGLGFTTLLGWGLAMRQPRSQHKISQARAQAAVDSYNDALLHPFQNRRD